MDFDVSGNFLATGDKGGRVVIFERVPYESPLPNTDLPTAKHKDTAYEFRSLALLHLKE